MSILITGFEPFGGDPENPARLSARAAVALLKAEGHDAHFLEVPCVFATAAPTVEAEAKRLGADVVVCAGLAARRTEISLETTAKNIIDARIPDNAGDQPRDVEVVVGGAKTLGTRLAVEKAKEAIEAVGGQGDGVANGENEQVVLGNGDDGERKSANGANGATNGHSGKRGRIPVGYSNDAGEYVCNALMYGTLHNLPESTSVGFVHVPRFEKVPLDDQAEALAIVAKETLAAQIRLRKAQGKCLGGQR